MMKDSKITSCLGSEQLEGGRKIRLEGENKKLCFYMLSLKCPLVVQGEVLNRGTKKSVFLKTVSRRKKYYFLMLLKE